MATSKRVAPLLDGGGVQRVQLLQVVDQLEQLPIRHARDCGQQQALICAAARPKAATSLLTQDAGGHCHLFCRSITKS